MYNTYLRSYLHETTTFNLHLKYLELMYTIFYILYIQFQSIYCTGTTVDVMSVRDDSSLVWLFTSVGERFGIMDANIW